MRCKQKIVEHYDNVVETYINTPFYLKTDHIALFCSMIRPYTLNKVIADIGCGTCHYAELLDAKKIVCIDPSAKMLFQRPLLPNQEKYLADGLDFFKQVDTYYDVTLLKECLHHFSNIEQELLLTLCHEKSKLTLIAGRPHDNQYPWFQAAQDNFENTALRISKLIEVLQTIGFSVVQKELIISVKIPAKQWIELIRNRFWSNLSSISSVELNNELDLLQTKYQEDVCFDDRIVVLIGT